MNKTELPKINALVADKIVRFLAERQISIPEAARLEAADRAKGGTRTFFAFPKQLVMLAEAMCDISGYPRKPWLLSAFSGLPMTVGWDWRTVSK